MTEVLNQKNPTMLEVLTQANDSADPVSHIKSAIEADKRIAQVLGYALNPKFKLPLPEGIPPYIPGDSPIGLAEIELLHLFNKFYIFFNQESPKARKEQMFIQWLEKMNPQEAEILIAIKDQNLTSLFPKLSEPILVSSMGWDWSEFLKLRAK